jgi:hypothetical protein
MVPTRGFERIADKPLRLFKSSEASATEMSAAASAEVLRESCAGLAESEAAEIAMFQSVISTRRA